MILSYSSDKEGWLKITFCNKDDMYKIQSEAIFIIECPQTTHDNIVDWLENETYYELSYDLDDLTIHIETEDINVVFRNLQRYTISQNNKFKKSNVCEFYNK